MKAALPGTSAADDGHAPSYYAATTGPRPEFPALEGELQADVCVVGGGFSGINTALELAERGLSVILLEARVLGWGASGRNGGQLIRGFGHDLERFRPLLGADGVRALKLLGLESLEIVRRRIERHAIDCDLTWGYCELATRARHLEHLKAECAELQALGYRHELRLLEADRMHEAIGSRRYRGGLLDRGSGHLHPLRLLLGEAAVARSLGVRLFERSAALRIDHGQEVCVHTAGGRVHAASLVLAGNAHIGDLEPELAGKVLPAGSYIIATEPLSSTLATELLPQNLAVSDMRAVLDYFRLSADRRLLFGGACHYSGRDPRDIAAYMRPKMLEVFPQLAGVRIDYQWSGLIGIGANRLPQIGRLPGRPNVYYAQAYSGHGLNATHLAGRLLAEAIAGQHSHGFELFARVPHRTFPGGPRLRAPLLALGMLWYRLRELF
ncbi:NAD(P)/FAD-dependent oxidoreductase [Azotobacter vinelandii]|uniref:NAD(P)/FAD-dependent oxidoreductase n=1 Tax=Azotobacter vinelandii TaxID=354 RepID=UPI0007731AF6|nr:FAD-binding oxidoreductase [Azotobacter vinelandii]